MAAPMSADQRLAAYRRWGLKIREHPGWKTHDRNSAGPWGPVYGIMIHHTGDDAPDDKDEAVLWGGRSDLPGPLCHDGQADDGTTVMISAGRANHAGSGSSRVLDAIRAGRVPPRPGPDDTDGNRHFYGRETMYSGLHTATLAAYRATVLACAAICEFHSWNPHVVIIGHKDWTTRKIDPGHLSIPQLRSDVAVTLAAGPPKGTKTMATLDAQDLTAIAELVRKNTPQPPYLELAIDLHTAEQIRKVAGPQFAAIGVAIAAIVPADIDEAALAATLAPLLVSAIDGFTPEQMHALAAEISQDTATQLADLLAARLQA